MAGLQTQVRTLLLWAVALESSLLALGVEVARESWRSVQDVWRDAATVAGDTYSHVCRRMSSAYGEWQVRRASQASAGGGGGGRGGGGLQRRVSLQTAPNRVAQAWHGCGQRLNLALIQGELRAKLAYHNLQFSSSLWIESVRAWLHQTVDEHLLKAVRRLNEQGKFLRGKANVRLTRWKKKAAESVKDKLERLTLRAKEYEDALETKLDTLTRSPSSKKATLAGKAIRKPSSRTCSSAATPTSPTNEDPRLCDESEAQYHEEHASRAAADRASSLLVSSAAAFLAPEPSGAVTQSPEAAHGTVTTSSGGAGVLSTPPPFTRDPPPPPPPASSSHPTSPSEPPAHALVPNSNHVPAPAPAPALPPFALDDPPKPPERPPKKPNLRSLFHGPVLGDSPKGLPSGPSGTPEKASPDTEMRRIEESANELRNLSPARTYYYRKPPAPDPPKSPELPQASAGSSATSTSSNVTSSTTTTTLTTPKTSVGSPQAGRSPGTAPVLTTHNNASTHHHQQHHHQHHLPPPASPNSRASTPDLPPPPPPPVMEEEVVVSDEPLPPPPSEVTVNHAAAAVAAASGPAADPNCREAAQGKDAYRAAALANSLTYHKDSYMAHRRDWKTGFEGRYRRTISPSAPLNRNALYNDASNNNNNSGSNNNNTMTGPAPTSSAPDLTASPPTPPAAAMLGGPLRPVSTSSSLVKNNNNTTTTNDNDNHLNNNGWAGHGRQSSTTVSFTAEELRAFKERRANASTHDREATPRLQPSQSSPALRSLASEGSTTSLGSTEVQNGSPASPSKLSPTHSWRTSLESLNRSVSQPSSQPPSQPVVRTTSLGEHVLHRPETAPVAPASTTTPTHDTSPQAASYGESAPSRNEEPTSSPSRSESMSESFSRSSSVTESSSMAPPPTVFLETSLDVPPMPQEHEPLASSPAAVASSNSSSSSSSSPSVSVPPDGAVTAHPATVTEEPTPSATTTTTTVASTKAPTVSPTSNALSKSWSPSTAILPLTVAPEDIPPKVPDEPPPCVSDPGNIVILGYGRSTYQEELEFENLSKEYMNELTADAKLLALLAPGPEHKTTAHYMEGVFSLELRKDLISRKLSTHPAGNPNRTATCLRSSSNVSNSSASAKSSCVESSTCNSNNNNNNCNNHNNNNNNNNHTTSSGSNEKSPLPADSAYFTTSECKAKLLSRLRGTGSLSGTVPPGADSQQLIKKKEELMASISRKLEILRAEREAIKEEIGYNRKLGSEVTVLVEARARPAESERYKRHVEEIDHITSLLLGLSGRLARAENALLVLHHDASQEEKAILEGKRDKLKDQLEEAKSLKDDIDRRALQVSKVLHQYLAEDEYADYDHFIKMKAKLIMDSREIEDKIKLGDEQLQALKDTLIKKP